MGTNTFTVRLADIQPVVPNDNPANAEYSIDKHLDFAVNGSLIVGYDDRLSRHTVTLYLTIPEETLETVADLLNAEAVDFSASVEEPNMVRISFVQGS